jgi:hypothetical protein
MPNDMTDILKNSQKEGTPDTAFDAAHPPVIGVARRTDEAGILGLHRSNGAAIAGFSEAGDAVRAESRGGNGIRGNGAFNGVVGETKAAEHSGVLGIHSGGGRAVTGVSDAPGGIGVHGKGTRLAGFFEGDIEVTGDIRLLNADCAEDFDISEVEESEPGTVMVIDQTGALRISRQAYDKKVAGVISGAGGYKPAIVLDKQGSRDRRLPVALLGKVYCKADAQYGSIEVGDLLTTSPTPGYSMKASDPVRAFGAVIGKALCPLREGQGSIPILIALQ